MSRRTWKALAPLALLGCAGLPPASPAGRSSPANAGDWGTYDVGFRRIHLELKGAAGEPRPLDVLLWYPADEPAYATAKPAVYASRLNGVAIVDPKNPKRWVPMSFTVTAERARDAVGIRQGGSSFPLIVFSHAKAAEPLHNAPTLERLASHGFIVAAPLHNGDTVDDATVDSINKLAGKEVLPCPDRGPGPCLDGQKEAMQNRGPDVAAIFDHIDSYFAGRVDLEHIGILGVSRGSLTALAAAGGSTVWNVKPDPRVDAIMLLASGERQATASVGVSKVRIPVLLVTGSLDHNTPVAVDVLKTLPGEQKGLVMLENAEHRVYSIGRCAQMQASGAVLQGEPRAIGEQLVFQGIMVNEDRGSAIDFCPYDYFVKPVDIRPLVKTVTGVDVTADNVPRTLSAITAMHGVVELATSFFGAVLAKDAPPRVPLKQYLPARFRLYQEGDVVGPK